MMIDVAKQFSPYPSGRYPEDGDYNGQRFRNEILRPALDIVLKTPDSKLTVDIDGVRSFGSSFLEEAFGGLIRKNIATKNELVKHLEIRCTKKNLFFYKDAIKNYINEASQTKFN